jgi:hypothetical protein
MDPVNSRGKQSGSMGAVYIRQQGTKHKSKTAFTYCPVIQSLARKPDGSQITANLKIVGFTGLLYFTFSSVTYIWPLAWNRV